MRASAVASRPRRLGRFDSSCDVATLRWETIAYRVHTLRRMVERGITREEVEQVVGAGEIIASYPDDVPYPIALLLGWPRGRPLHVVGRL